MWTPPDMPGFSGGDAIATTGDGKKRQVNHTDAPQDAVRRFGTDLAP
jgi:hypothetical protein